MPTASQLRPPALPLALIPRPRLANLFAESKCLYLLEAPSGYGKTLLMQLWLAKKPTHCQQWLHLTHLEQNPVKFEKLLLLALQGLLSPQSQPAPLGFFELLEALDQELQEPCWLVIDNAHQANSQPAAALLNQLLNHRPQQLNLLLAGKSLPQLKTTRLRLQDQLVELDAEQLSFQPEEALLCFESWHPEFNWLEQANHYQRSQGWPAALKLPASLWPTWIAEEVLQDASLASQHCLLQPRSATPNNRVAKSAPLIWWGKAELSQAYLDQQQQLVHSITAKQAQTAIDALRQLTWSKCLQGQPRSARGYNRKARQLALDQQLETNNDSRLVWDQAFIEASKGHLQLAAQLLPSRLQRNDPNAAAHYLLTGYLAFLQARTEEAHKALRACLLVSGEHQPYIFVQALLGLARSLTLEAEPQAAYELLNQAEQFLLASSLNDNNWQTAITLTKAQIWLHEGKLDLAFTWLSQLHQTSLETGAKSLDLALTLTRVQLGLNKAAEALEVLNWLKPQLPEAATAPQRVHFQVLLALALADSRQMSLAQETLQTALQAAAPESLLLPFLESTPTLGALAQEAGKKLASGSDLYFFTQQLLKRLQLQPLSQPQDLKNKLSSREMDVLRLVTQGLSNEEIGQRLFISVHTVKSHLKHLMKKLCVRSRTQAVTRARELRLL